MKVRFIGDYDFNGEILDGLLRRDPAIDLISGHEADLAGIPDPEVLARAANDGRVLVTHDQRTMPHHFADFISRCPSQGVFIVPQRVEIGVAIDELLLIWSASDAEEWANLILYLPL